MRDWRQLCIDAALFLCLLPFWVIGFTVGIIWAIIIYTWAAIVAGFKAGAHGQSD